MLSKGVYNPMFQTLSFKILYKYATQNLLYFCILAIQNISPSTLCFSSNKTEATKAQSILFGSYCFDKNFPYIFSSLSPTGGDICPETILIRLFLKDCTAWEGTNTEVSEELQPKGITHIGGCWEGQSPGGWTPSQSRGRASGGRSTRDKLL